MKIHKKIGLGLMLIIAVSTFFAISQQKALAATFTTVYDVSLNQNYQVDWRDRSHINLTVYSSSMLPINSIPLTDGQWDDNWDYTGTIDGSCKVEVNGFGPNQSVGWTNADGKGPWNAAASVAKLTVNRMVNGSCKTTVKNQPVSIGQWQNAQISFQATASDTIDSLNPAGNMSFSEPQLQSDGTVKYFRASENGQKCQDVIVVAKDNTMKLFEQDANKDSTSGAVSPIDSSCYLVWSAQSDLSADNAATPSNVSMVLGAATVLTPPTQVGTGGPSGGGQAGSNGAATCETASSTSFEWLFCPILEAFDKLTKTLTDILENLLDFNVSQYLNDQVKSSWNIMKNIASAILVIIMLIAVISQAVGGGPVDAYTLRKILPRLVAAVILIQLSWVMLIWFITIADDMGHAVRDIMSAPFGGWRNLDLAHLIAPLGGTGTLTTGVIFTGIGIAFAFSGLTIFGVVLLALSAILTDLLAFVFLVLRQVFITIGVIIFPIAIIMWILPGTQRYWKLWSDNFIKLLLLFPLIMALVYGGRIFAHIFVQATAGSDKILATFVLFIGFFGPYLMLPKAFRWGGQLYAAAASGAFNATQGMREFPRKYSLSRAQENRQFRAERRAARIGHDPGSASRWDRLLAGGYNLARSRGARERQYARTVAEGQKASREAVSEELLTAGYQNWGHDQKLDALEAWLRGESYAGINAEGNDELRLFAFKTLADLGDQDRIRRARQQGKLKGSVWLKGRAENISQLNAQASDMGIEHDLSGVSPDKMAGWKSHTWKEWIRQVQQGVVMDNSDDGGGDLDITEVRDSSGRVIGTDPMKRQDQLQRAQAQAQRILKNQLVFDRLSSDQQEIVKRMASMEGTQVIETPLSGGVEVPTGSTLAARTSVRQNVMTRLSEDPHSAAPVASSLAPRIIEAARSTAAGIPLTADQQGDIQLFHQVLDRGTAPDATPEMQKAVSALAGAVNSALSGHEAETERQLTASGSPAVAAGVAAERARSDDVRRTLGI